MVLLLLSLGLMGGCAPTTQRLVQFEGATMGTSYHVSYGSSLSGATAASGAKAGANATVGVDADADKRMVDSMLVALNQSVSTYIQTSLISRLNASNDSVQLHPVDAHFAAIFARSSQIYMDTGGAFNPAIGPLVDAYGFGPTERGTAPDSAMVVALLQLVDFESFVLDDTGLSVQKRNPSARLDFSAIAKGYGVDMIADFLEARGTLDYFVEIGGEIRTGGQHPDGRPWRTGIEKPSLNPYSDQEMQEIVELASSAMATSGNYRNYYEQDGKKFVHIIDPFTGYSRPSSLLSVSVLAPDCMTADAYATALMVMGTEKALAFVEARAELEAFFIWVDDSGAFQETMSSGFPVALPN